MNLTTAQQDQLLKPINPVRVSKDGKGFSHVEAYEIRAHMNRIFGITGWSTALESCDLVFETESERNGKSVWTVCYRATCRVEAYYASYTDVACGDAQNQPSRADAHDLAAKTAASQAFKRAAVNFGDQFGLSLYDKGSTRPLVGRCLPWDEGTTETADVSEHITTPLAPERDNNEPPQREMSSLPPSPSEAVQVEIDEDSPAAGNDEFDLLVAQVNAIVLMAPEQAMQTVGDLMTQSAKHGWNNRRVPADAKGRTLGAVLQAGLQWAASQQKTAVA